MKPNQHPARAACHACPSRSAACVTNTEIGTRHRSTGTTRLNGGNDIAKSAADASAASASPRLCTMPPARIFIAPRVQPSRPSLHPYASRTNFSPFFGRLLHRLHQLLYHQLIRREFVRSLLAYQRDEMRKLRAVALNEGTLACCSAGRRNVGRSAVQQFHDTQRREPSASTRCSRLEPPAIVLAD